MNTCGPLPISGSVSGRMIVLAYPHTPDSGSVSLGSNPSPAALLKLYIAGIFLCQVVL